MKRTMGNYNLWLMAIILIGCAIELIQGAAIGSAVTSDKIPANTVGYKRYVRRRPSPHDPNLIVYEVRHVYFTTIPKPKPSMELSDDEMDRRIRCDFQPNLAECKSIHTGPKSSTTTKTSTSTTTTRQPPPAIKTSTTARTTTTSALPFLPELPDESTSTNDIILSTEPPNLSNEDYKLPSEDENYDDAIDNDDVGYENDEDPDTENDYSLGPSIGRNDMEIDETDKNL